MIQLLKSIFRDWCPPKLKYYLDRIRGTTNTYTYEGVYYNFSDCAESCNSSSLYMDEHSDENEAKIFWELVRNRTNEAPLLGRDIIIPLIVCLKEEKSIALLDVGGASNPIISKIPKKTSKSIDYFVLDRPELGNLIRAYGDEPSINVVDRLEDISTSKKYKVIYFGSSVQYLHDDEALESMFTWKANLIIFADSVFSTSEDLWVKQINMKPLQFPNHWWSLEKLKSMAFAHNYHLVSRMTTSTGEHLHNVMGKSFYQTLVFKRT